jgi:DNA-binding MarR family transcriptional regulator
VKELSTVEFADQILEIIPDIMREFLRHHIQEVSKGLVTFPQFLTMEYLIRQGESRMKDLAAFMNVTMATMTGIIDRLVRDGFTKRLLDSSDRRIVKVTLTSKGLLLTQKIQKARREVITDIFDKISPRDREEYLRILKKIHHELKTREKR